MKKKTTIKHKLKSFFRTLSYQIFFYIYGKIKVKNKFNKNILTEKSITFNFYSSKYGFTAYFTFLLFFEKGLYCILFTFYSIKIFLL